MALHLYPLLAHAFGKRYDIPVPLWLFVIGGGAVVFISFLLVLPRPVPHGKPVPLHEPARPPFAPRGAQVASAVLLLALIGCGLFGSQEVAENILPTAFWLIVWIAIPITCGIVGDWARLANPYVLVARIFDKTALRRAVFANGDIISWPRWLAWWPAAAFFFTIACGELIYNAWATLPAVTAAGLLVYGLITAAGAMLFGAEAWLEHAEIFSVLFSTWGRIGFFRFGEAGRRGFGGGLHSGFSAHPSRITFIFITLVSVTFDGLLATPAWRQVRTQLTGALTPGTASFDLAETAAFLLLIGVAWVLFGGFATAVRAAGRLAGSRIATLCGLIPSLLPIAFGYLVAHNSEYLAINGQLLIPLLGNPTGHTQWLPAPFNDSYEVNPNILPSGMVWYAQVALIILVHIAAILLAHRFLANSARDRTLAKRGEWPWITVMVAYTMTSLWLLAQPVVAESGSSAAASSPYLVGALFPLSGTQAPLAQQEYAGVQIAANLVNAEGGIDGRPIQLDVRDYNSTSQAKPQVDSLRKDGVAAIVGAYSSSLSMPASAATAADSLVYWEAGAVADQVTGRGLPMVFRIGATGANLGANSANFAVTQLAPRLHRDPSSLRISYVVANDDYANSVYAAAQAIMSRAGMPTASVSHYDPNNPIWQPVINTLQSAHPDILILASHIPDGISFRRAMIAANVHVLAMIGSTMAQCMSNFGDALGPDAVGVFSSDRPGEGFWDQKLPAGGRALYEQLAAQWKTRFGVATPTEEGLSGFSAAWVLFHDVLPQAAKHGLSPANIAAAARSLNLPQGSLPNGAGVLFAQSGNRLGQNLRAAAVIWQWQAPRHSVVVWPAPYAWGKIGLLPLPQ